jgi:NMD protein affecting ribosome stability and mRNA decay
VYITSAMCVQCSYPTELGMCLMCQGVLTRTCARCRVDVPTVWYDIFCLPCAEAEGPAYLAEVQARKERAAHLQACEDYGHPTYADKGPLCPICRFGREGFAFVVGGGLN